MIEALACQSPPEHAMSAPQQLVHYSAAPFVGPLCSVEQASIPNFKPKGFWISVEGNGDGWKEWCEGEEWGLDRLAHAHDVVLRSEANILRLSSSDGIDAFDRQFSSHGFASTYRSILWADVATKYQGIIIAPYIWARRLSDHGAEWYYGWDCASGCIWDAGAVESITLREVS